MVKRNERPDKGMWSFPGGAVEFGETTKHAAIREVKEETGLDIRIEELFDVVTYLPYERGPASRNHVVVVDYLAKPRGGRVRLNHESADFGWFTPRQIQGMDTTGQVRECAIKFARMKIR
jgi:ADP-ribose pyrophosphatase YjhB (NUDIX family)